MPPSAQDTNYDNRVGCLQHGMGSPTRQATDRWEVVSSRNRSPHQLSQTASYLSSPTVLCQRQQRDYRADKVGQCHSSDIHQQTGGNSLSTIVPTGIDNLEVVFTERNVFLVAEHLPGKDNIIADRESRLTRDRCDWMLNPLVFQRIQQQMGPLQTDLFASRLTKQLPSFFSWRLDPEATATDAFNQNWAQTRGFANPPRCLIARCLSQIKRQMARIVIIIPQWASQPWYPIILGMLEDYPRILLAGEDLVILPTSQDFIMNQGVPELVAWPVSGNPSNHEEFLWRLQPSSLHPRDQKHSQTTTLCFEVVSLVFREE